jgi:hypothetical protein
VKKHAVIHRHFDEAGTTRNSLFFFGFGKILISKPLKGSVPMGRKSDYGNGLFKQLEELAGRLDSVEKDLRVEKQEHKADVERLNDKVGKLEATIEKQERIIEVLTNDNERLKRTLNNDSSNSSLPPSGGQNQKPGNTYNGRPKTNKKPGGQPGRKGVTLTKEDVLEKLSSGKYEHRMTTIGDKKTKKHITKYKLDIEIIPVITEGRIYAGKDGKFNIPAEYRSDVTYGNIIKTMVVDLYAEGVVSNDRIGEFVNGISGNLISLSAGSVYEFIRNFADKSAPGINQIEEGLLNAETVCTDGTVVSVNGEQAYIRNFSTNEYVLYKAMAKKSINALKAIEFLTKFAGTLEHDHETALYHFGSAHGECNVHLLRYLKKNTEEAATHWAGDLTGLLLEINAARKSRIASALWFTDEEKASYAKRYDKIIADGHLQNKATKGKLAKQEEKTLLNRLAKYKDNHLLFLHNISVPFDNNMSERDLRKCKNRQKMSGGFRKHSGNEMYCNVMSIVETSKRKGLNVLESIRKIFEGTPSVF